jgi:glycosyltransferase involved in cell wall biosynthesis
MNVLLTNNHLMTYGGTENWTYTVYKKLIQLGFNVDVFSLKHNVTFSGRFKNFYRSTPKNEYDLVLCNHNSCFNLILNKVKYKKLTFISHGTIPYLEKPLAGADRYISVSKEIQSHILKRGFESDVVLNPIDLEVYYPSKPLNLKIENIFSLCQQQAASNKIKTLGINTFQIEKVRRELSHKDYNDSDICVGLGRSAFESLACGRPVIVYDYRGYNGELYDGIISKDNISELIKNNCSGRRYKMSFSLDQIKSDIETSYIADTDYYRSIAEKYFNVNKIIKQLIK